MDRGGWGIETKFLTGCSWANPEVLQQGLCHRDLNFDDTVQGIFANGFFTAWSAVTDGRAVVEAETIDNIVEVLLGEFKPVKGKMWRKAACPLDSHVQSDVDDFEVHFLMDSHVQSDVDDFEVHFLMDHVEDEDSWPGIRSLELSNKTSFTFLVQGCSVKLEA